MQKVQQRKCGFESCKKGPYWKYGIVSCKKGHLCHAKRVTVEIWNCVMQTMDHIGNIKLSYTKGHAKRDHNGNMELYHKWTILEI